MRTSYSALQTYKQCPQKYKFQEIDRVPSKKSKEAVFGTLIHSSLKFMFEKTPLFPTLDEVIEFYRSNFPPAENSIFETEIVRNAYFGEGLKMLKNFYLKNAPWNFSVIDLESRFEIPLVDEKKQETHVLSGKIDRIDKLPDEFYEIIDYKTSKRLPSQESVDNDLQLSIYSLGVQKKWPHLKPEQIKVSLYFLKHSEKLTSTRTADSIEKTKNDVIDTIGQIRNKLEKKETFEPIPSPLCDYCSYRSVCPAWRHLYRNRQPTTYNQQQIDEIIKEYFELKKNVEKEEDKIAEFHAQIKNYMEQENLTRVFGDNGYISKTLQTRYKYNFDKIREILEPIGKWPEILDADEKKLKILMKSLPEEIQQKIKELGIETKEFTALRVSVKKINPPA
ncbi:MAG: hypothetical protein A3G49_02015 [Candidatus Sungbacteria bacterium RIFCSPLOWO2_12_FULL_41_11]|uniref:PD-(D/E)XK endonuclease-like domain-containing protein n=1 Tax=Candidatus Sungbacteria bacterium RIFCSPLOWO2_12_FULL_41_11 TaxID=1802286 RepID=A0A1G2LU26_9BACT|nr:MAG: hypothetical protein UV01_C0007G0017 [Parcubacteria group bacterium GW2011_GWA2_42_14]OHA00095.1 MAG: hypothetical protein A3D41_00480 [Candidatus Sungbacteria bacterium RIFCSPHIGHO2_02_FULL_41_12b]OHA14379.1 MAG: hypothetical protein A3G49_02015 [Candidatus Sungbacteria bacterium RIFCSPLOWO2_12_FULL_41_11]